MNKVTIHKIITQGFRDMRYQFASIALTRGRGARLLPGEGFGQEGDGLPIIIIAATMSTKHVLRTCPNCPQSNNQESDWAPKKYSRVSYHCHASTAFCLLVKNLYKPLTCTKVKHVQGLRGVT